MQHTNSGAQPCRSRGSSRRKRGYRLFNQVSHADLCIRITNEIVLFFWLTISNTLGMKLWARTNVFLVCNEKGPCS
jgi:hypothetical protein